MATGRKGQEKYIQFQVQWYNHCSIFLAPKKLNITSKITNPSDETYSTLLLWRNFCDSSSQPLQQCQNAVIHLSSFVYDYLLQKTHSFKAMSMPDSSSSSKCSSEAPVDNDDVYYHFGGAIISEMLHVRYKSIKKCSESRRCLISEEITILQAINSKDKTSMPAYLQYRDQGYMYSPQATFISFFREIDNCVREVVNEVGFKKYKDDIVEVQ